MHNVFKIEDPKFLQIVAVHLEKEYMELEFRYRTDADLVSMFFAWGLELGTKEDVKWVMRECIKEEWKYWLGAFMAIARPREVFVSTSGEWLHFIDFVPPLRRFIVWGADMDKEAHQEEAQVGWDYIKDYILSKEWMLQVFGSEDTMKAKKKVVFKMEDYWLIHGKPMD
ncbi:hypothetical protein SUGI_0881600 [Cryptomeria japonica]|nr:hypothetical protein SUGI_0881600 [Cryptomeria japonica]